MLRQSHVELKRPEMTDVCEVESLNTMARYSARHERAQTVP